MAAEFSRRWSGYLRLLLLLPTAFVFVEALADGLPAYWQALSEPDTIASIELTLLGDAAFAARFRLSATFAIS